MVERLILVIAGGLVALLFVYSVILAPSAGPNLEEIAKSAPDDPWFQEHVVSSDVPVLVSFEADWCGVCRMLEPHLKALLSTYGEQLKRVTVDVDERKTIAAHYGASSLPMVVLFEQGQPVNGFVGYRSYEELTEILKPQLDKLTPAQGPVNSFASDSAADPDSAERIEFPALDDSN